MSEVIQTFLVHGCERVKQLKSRLRFCDSASHCFKFGTKFAFYELIKLLIICHEAKPTTANAGFKSRTHHGEG